MALDPTKHPDWQIAQDAEKSMKTVETLAAELGLEKDELLPYGHYMGKIEQQAVLRRLADRPNGKYVDVTAITPTPLGEGKSKYREFAKPVPPPTTRQAVVRGRPVLHYRSVSFVRGVGMPWLDLIRSKSVASERKKSRSSSSCFCGSAASRRWYTARMRPRNVRSVRSPF